MPVLFHSLGQSLKILSPTVTDTQASNQSKPSVFLFCFLTASFPCPSFLSPSLSLSLSLSFSKKVSTHTHAPLSQYIPHIDVLHPQKMSHPPMRHPPQTCQTPPLMGSTDLAFMNKISCWIFVTTNFRSHSCCKRGFCAAFCRTFVCLLFSVQRKLVWHLRPV